MKIQLALDRMSIEEAEDMVRRTEPYIDWIEVGTSLIKEFGMASVEALKREFPHKIIVADMKTFDNAKYEFELCFKAGADVATVMGAAPPVTVGLCAETALRMEKQVMIDLLHTSPEQQRELALYPGAIHCLHVSKDQQEGGGLRLGGAGGADAGHRSDPGAQGAAGGQSGGFTEAHEAAGGRDGGGEGASGGPGAEGAEGLRLAAAGGITLESLPGLLSLKPEVIIVGSAITKASDPAQAAREFKERIREYSGESRQGSSSS
ncbi:3-hexulose-6-phosphate synthase [Paenibacillus sophorae]|uniref:3-hexulose-6-phosphate synthase n=1 Tax=Paenibacillus sophorae TaxID=1333845 RepID=A0A1H8PE44_9BACL|nr:orotidine 5'-phosphate decarboxylase / HUMPS family protein [Paenibacillus sophorae]QWU16545.1 orotidine 5'-phosphate decarboxylase [Paenibacillus sophorae]SEO40269.1 3-hexulose-6-phosphate synthase [Paenibacillus sophorae]